MSKVFRVQGETAFDYKKFNLEYNEEKSILISNQKNTIPYNLDKNLTLRLFNKNSNVFIQGQISFILSGVQIKTEDSIIIGIQFYSDKSREVLIYQTYSKISGIALNFNQSINWSVPINFGERPKLRVTECVANYYITLQSNLSESMVDNDGGLFLLQYSFSCIEIVKSEG